MIREDERWLVRGAKRPSSKILLLKSKASTRNRAASRRFASNSRGRRPPTQHVGSKLTLTHVGLPFARWFVGTDFFGRKIFWSKIFFSSKFFDESYFSTKTISTKKIFDETNFRRKKSVPICTIKFPLLIVNKWKHKLIFSIFRLLNRLIRIGKLESKCWTNSTGRFGSFPPSNRLGFAVVL